MDLRSLIIFKKSCKFFMFTIIFTSLLVESSPKSSKTDTCEPLECGNGPKISHPFWIPQQQESHCGSPGFNITCTNNKPIIRISNDDYVVKDIFYANKSILLANSKVYDENNTCPTPMHNFSIDGSTSPFTYSDTYADLFFFYNCSFDYENHHYSVVCSSHGSYHSFAVFHPEVVERNYSIESCQRVVNAPVSGDNLKILPPMNYADILRKGFVLQWGEAEKNGSSKFSFRLKIMLGGVALMVGFGIVLIIYCCCKMSSFSKSLAFLGLRPKNGNDAEAFITQYRFSTPRRYRYSEIKRMTNTFKDELGRGGFGSVFKGTLADGSIVAIKVLKESKGNGEEFFNEVASIGRTSHVNIVALKGFCYEGPKRALVYEFMPNGSLEKFIFQNIPKDSEQYLRVGKLYEIALGIARGLEYLHRGCNTRILHFDIKPHNILLDEEFCPKISDFGLAKLHSSKESIVSMVEARGTIGYIAPEVFNRNFGGVSHKSDVYSYGMMVVEMVGGRKNLDVGVVHSSEIYFPQWIYKQLELDEDLQLLKQGPMTAVENEIARKMILVGLWCIQADPSQRPSMNKVIEMLVGSTEALTIPPNPFFSSPPRPPASSSTTLETISRNENLQIAE